MGDEKEELRPVHKICRNNVDIPRVLFEESNIEGEVVKRVCVQWFGEADYELPKESQFLFDILSDADSLHWWGHPEWFDVVFLGQAKDWPRPEMAQLVADKAAEGNLDVWIVWLCNHHVQVKYSNSPGPQSFVVLLALLGDPNVGVITPRPHRDMEKLE